jgi:hypothetical protein
MTAVELLEALEAKSKEAHDERDALYWAFTRQAQAPPVPAEVCRRDVELKSAVTAVRSMLKDELEAEDHRKDMIRLARDQHGREGQCEIDDNAQVSGFEENDGRGCYVQSWVWVEMEDEEDEDIEEGTLRPAGLRDMWEVWQGGRWEIVDGYHASEGDARDAMKGSVRCGGCDPEAEHPDVDYCDRCRPDDNSPTVTGVDTGGIIEGEDFDGEDHMFPEVRALREEQDGSQ